MSEKVWTCKIGGKGIVLPDGADYPMRRAVERAYFEITGERQDFLFSGWGGHLTPSEREVAYQPPPSFPQVAGN